MIPAGQIKPPRPARITGPAGWHVHLTFEPACNLARRLYAAAGRRRAGKGQFLDAQQYAAEIATAIRRTRVYLATGHRNHDTSENAPTNLAAWCQRRHILHDDLSTAAAGTRTGCGVEPSGTCSSAPTVDPRALGGRKSGAK